MLVQASIVVRANVAAGTSWLWVSAKMIEAVDALFVDEAGQISLANVIAMGARLVGIEMAKACIETFLATPFGGGRHEGRVEKLSHPHFAKEHA